MAWLVGIELCYKKFCRDPVTWQDDLNIVKTYLNYKQSFRLFDPYEKNITPIN